MKALAVAALIGAPAAAQDLAIDAHRIDRCLGAYADTPMFCVGREAQDCIDRNGAGADMIVGACFQAEAAFWDGFLNRQYRDVLSLAKAREAGDEGYAPDNLTTAVRDMQRGWIAYRDATCDHALALARPFGSAAGPAVGKCLMEQTARQVFVLTDLAQEYRR